MKNLPTLEDFLNEEAPLQKADQSQLVKNITKSFDVSDLKIYLKGMMADFDIPTRKKLIAYLDDGKYRKVVDYLYKETSDATMQSKLKTLQKIFIKEPGE